jgi:hypothetical protein
VLSVPLCFKKNHNPAPKQLEPRRRRATIPPQSAARATLAQNLPDHATRDIRQSIIPTRISAGRSSWPTDASEHCHPNPLVCPASNPYISSITPAAAKWHNGTLEPWHSPKRPWKNLRSRTLAQSLQIA